MAAGEALATALVFPLAGGASGGKVQLSMQKMCQSLGGVRRSKPAICRGRKRDRLRSRPRTSASRNGGAYLPGGSCLFEGAQQAPKSWRRACARCRR
jgi:hypothetical protein